MSLSRTCHVSLVVDCDGVAMIRWLVDTDCYHRQRMDAVGYGRVLLYVRTATTIRGDAFNVTTLPYICTKTSKRQLAFDTCAIAVRLALSARIPSQINQRHREHSIMTINPPLNMIEGTVPYPCLIISHFVA